MGEVTVISIVMAVSCSSAVNKLRPTRLRLAVTQGLVVCDIQDGSTRRIHSRDQVVMTRLNAGTEMASVTTPKPSRMRIGLITSPSPAPSTTTWRNAWTS